MSEQVSYILHVHKPEKETNQAYSRIHGFWLCHSQPQTRPLFYLEAHQSGPDRGIRSWYGLMRKSMCRSQGSRVVVDERSRAADLCASAL